MIADLIKLAQAEGAYAQSQHFNREQVADYLKVKKDAYREDLEAVLAACELAYDATSATGIQATALYQSMAWLRGEIGELKNGQL